MEEKAKKDFNKNLVANPVCPRPVAVFLGKSACPPCAAKGQEPG